MKLQSLFFALLLISVASGAQAAVDKSLVPLTDAQMSQLCGGLELPNGIDINVGIDNQVSINGQRVADSQFSINGTTVQTSSSGVTQIQGVNGVTNISQLEALGQTIITNTANNLTLAQARTINIDITNFTRQNMQALNSISLIQAQAAFGLRNGFH